MRFSDCVIAESGCKPSLATRRAITAEATMLKASTATSNAPNSFMKRSSEERSCAT